jgi:hypothetical protein
VFQRRQHIVVCLPFLKSPECHIAGRVKVCLLESSLIKTREVFLLNCDGEGAIIGDFTDDEVSLGSFSVGDNLLCKTSVAMC